MSYRVHGILQARILEWVAVPFSRASSQPRGWTQVFHIADGFFTSWAPRELSLSQNGQTDHVCTHVLCVCVCVGAQFCMCGCVLAWRIPGAEELGGLLTMGSQSRTRLKRLSSSSSSSRLRETGWEWKKEKSHWTKILLGYVGIHNRGFYAQTQLFFALLVFIITYTLK